MGIAGTGRAGCRHLVNIMEKLINDKEPEPGEGIIHHEEGVDFIPANIELAGLETSLVNVMSREMVSAAVYDVG